MKSPRVSSVPRTVPARTPAFPNRIPPVRVLARALVDESTRPRCSGSPNQSEEEI